MSVSYYARRTFSSVINVKIIRNSLPGLLKHHVILSPSFNQEAKGMCLQLSRLHCTKIVVPNAVDDDCDKDDSMYLYQKLSRKENIARIMDCIGCSESLASSALREIPKLKYISSSEISRATKFLNEKGISRDIIMNNIWLLGLKTDELDEKFNILDDLGIVNHKLAYPLLQIPLERLKNVAKWSQEIVVPGNKTKISIVCDKLKCDPAEIVLAASVHKFIKTVPFDRMITIFDILLAEGVPTQKILQDLWVVRYRVEKVEARIMHAREGGVEQFKTWMVRCTEKILNNTIRIQAEKRALFGPHNDSMVEYISSRLNVSRHEAEMILVRQPQLRRVGAAKLCNTFNFLLGKEGKDDPSKTDLNGQDDAEMGPKFDSLQISSSSRILCHSLDTMKARLTRLRALGFEPYNPVILYKSKRKFEEFVERLKEKQALEAKSGETGNLEGATNGKSKAGQADTRR